VTLTEAGRIFLGHARTIVDEAESAKTDLKNSALARSDFCGSGLTVSRRNSRLFPGLYRRAGRAIPA